jgi:hypothetical protein
VFRFGLLGAKDDARRAAMKPAQCAPRA